MSASPDDTSFMAQLNQLLSGQSINQGLYDPRMSTAIGLLSAGGPSIGRPVGIGEAFQNGLLSGRQANEQGLDYATKMMMMRQNMARMQYMLNPPPVDGGQPSPQTAMPPPQQAPAQAPVSPDADVGAFPGSLLQAQQQSQPQGQSAPQAQPVNQAAAAQVDPRIPPQQMVTAPATVADPMQDPYYNYLAGGARMGLPGWDTLAGQRQTFLLAQPQFQAEQARQKALATLPEEVITSAMRYGLQPQRRSPTDSIYNPVSDPNNPLGAIFQLLMYGQGFGQPQPSASSPSPARSSTPATPSNPNGIIPSVLTPQQFKTQEEFGTQNVTQGDKWGQEAQDALGANARYDQMLGALGNIKTFSWAPQVQSLQEAVNSIDPTHTMFSDKLADMQEFNKGAGQATLAQSKAMGSRIAAQEVSMIQSYNANNKLTPTANYAIIQFGQGMNDWNIMKSQAYQEWMQANPSSNYQTFLQRYQQIADPAIFALQRMTDPQTHQFTPAGELLVKQLAPTPQAFKALMAKKATMQKYGWLNLDGGGQNGGP